MVKFATVGITIGCVGTMRGSVPQQQSLEVDRERWTTSKNVGKHYQILEQTFVDLGFAFKNPSYSADEPLSESIKFHCFIR